MIGSNCLVQTGVYMVHGCSTEVWTIFANRSMISEDAEIRKDCFIRGGAAIDHDAKIGDL
jgi:carbonic anhydrase/acetyltransferase-like protein (isoleucine patch superfamily)